MADCDGSKSKTANEHTPDQDHSNVNDIIEVCEGVSVNGSLTSLTDDDGTNKTRILCQRCPSLVVSPHLAKLVKKEFFLPNMYQKNEQAPVEGVKLTDYWLISDMMTFDNVGFSKTVDNIKYLICADCEVGPIGWHYVQDKTAYYIAIDRVKHG